MFHYQVGSLEEEPPILAARLAERGLPRAAVVYDHSPVGRGYLDAFDASRATYGIDLTGAVAISPVEPEGIKIASIFIAGIILVSMLSRAMRAPSGVVQRQESPCLPPVD